MGVEGGGISPLPCRRTSPPITAQRGSGGWVRPPPHFFAPPSPILGVTSPQWGWMQHLYTGGRKEMPPPQSLPIATNTPQTPSPATLGGGGVSCPHTPPPSLTVGQGQVSEGFVTSFVPKKLHFPSVFPHQRHLWGRGGVGQGLGISNAFWFIPGFSRPGLTQQDLWQHFVTT